MPRSGTKYSLTAHLHVLRPGAKLSSDETIVGLCICAKGLIQVRATTFIYFVIFICIGLLSGLITRTIGVV